MQQVLFHIPILKETFPPDGLPVHGFGVMLFVTFVLCVWALVRVARRVGANLPNERTQDLVIACFIGGLVGARITFMLMQPGEVRWQDFFAIWKGGIVLYGGIISGTLTFIAFYYVFLKRVGVPFWKLVDAVGPTLALGIALGRIGCFLNGCCWGHAAPQECPSVGFPLLTCPADKVVVNDEGYQTKTGFTVIRGPDGIQSVVDRVEPGSAAARAGLQAGDRITGVNGKKNGGILLVSSDSGELLTWARDTALERGAAVMPVPDKEGKAIRIAHDDVVAVATLKLLLKGRFVFLGQVFDNDVFSDLIHNPHGVQSLDLVVDRAGQEVRIGSFTPRTIGLHPTQTYETISMLLLMVFLLSYYPFRAYDGQVFTLFVVGYAIHRFLNETLRNDTEIVGIPALNMTLSQNISVFMFLGAVGLEAFHRVRLRRRAQAPPTVSVPVVPVN